MVRPRKPVETEDITLTPEQQSEQLEQPLERLDKLAESELEMIRLFLDRGKTRLPAGVCTN